MASSKPITNDRLYDVMTSTQGLINSTRLELKGDIQELRRQFDALEAGRLTRLEGKMGDFEVSQAKRDSVLSQNQAVLSTKVLTMWGIGSAIFVVISELIVNRVLR